MSNANLALPIRCPNCEHEACTLVVRSLTVMTLTCAECRHTWATDVRWLPAHVQEKVRALGFKN